MKYLLLLCLILLIPAKVEAATSPFYLGMFEDANQMNTPTGFEAMINNLRSHNLDTVLFTNSNNSFHLPILDVSDRLGFNVIWGGPMAELSSRWFNNPIAPTTQNAENTIGPLVEQIKNHSSVKGYNLLDDTTISQADKLKLAIGVYKSHDTRNPATAVFVNGHEKAFSIASPDRLLTYYYPAKAVKNVCDWNFISPTQNDFSNNLRNVSKYKPQGIPLWTVLQTHGAYPTTTPGVSVTALRTPTPEEISLQHWISIGEGSKSIFWFIYSTQQFWTGLKDNPLLFDKISEVALRTKPLVPTLSNLEKTADYFGLNGSGNRYVSTLVDPSTGKYYILVTNAVCNSTQQLTITSPIFSGNLKNIESGVQTSINSPITINPGDGQIFEVVNSDVSIPSPILAPNLFTNPGFETKSGSFPANWGSQPSSSNETTIVHSGANSFKLTGAASVYVNQKLNLKPATLYTLNYWIKSPTGIGSKGITFRAVSSDTLTPVTNISSLNGPAFDWKQVTETFYTPTTYVDSRLDLMWELKAGETVYIDDVNLCEGQGCLPKVAILSTSFKFGDVDKNGMVDIFDYNQVMSDFGKIASDLIADLDKNGKVDIFDYNIVLSNFGK